MGKKYDEIEKSIAAAASTLPIAGPMVKVFGMIALEGLREYSRFVDTQELAVLMSAKKYTYAESISRNRIKTLCDMLTNDGTKP